jgi:hypothetical protein
VDGRIILGEILKELIVMEETELYKLRTRLDGGLCNETSGCVIGGELGRN